jgi:hypothetical protein
VAARRTFAGDGTLREWLRAVADLAEGDTLDFGKSDLLVSASDFSRESS